MVDKVKIEPKIITVFGRPSFYDPAEGPKYRTKNGVPDKGTPEKPKKPQYRLTWLIDPSSEQGAATIKEIKDESARQLDLFFGGRDKWPKDNAVTGTKGIIMCWGKGNDLPKVYDGYKDMFFVKVSDTVKPIIGDRRGRQIEYLTDNAWHVVDRETGKTTDEIVPGEEIPYAGSNCRGRISLYVYNNEQAGVNANFRSVQFVSPNAAFGGGGGRRTASEELAAMAGDAPKAAAESDPWG